jgi:N-acetylmuramoyl-L-alanine amidase
MMRQSIGVITGCSVLLLLTVSSFYRGPVHNSGPANGSGPVHSNNQSRHGINTIIVDAGHGGRDPGANGAYSNEKTLTLEIAMKLGRTLHATFPNVRIVMTRTTDVFQPVGEKAQIANDNKGDLFLCIHCNLRVKIETRFIGYRKEAYYTGKGKARKKHYRKVRAYHRYEVDDPDPRGTETYIFTARKEGDKEKAILENNREGEAEDSTEDTVDETNDPQARIRAMLYSKYYFLKSYQLASMVQDEFEPLGRNDGVKQRYTGIRVLESTNMPSILVETGYLSNPDDEKYLNSDDGQQQIADAITKAVVRYKASIEGKSTEAVPESVPNDSAQNK